MPEKTERLQRLLNDGYSIDAVESDDALIEATLRRGSSTIVLTFGPGEAIDLLYALAPAHRHASSRRA